MSRRKSIIDKETLTKDQELLITPTETRVDRIRHTYDPSSRNFLPSNPLPAWKTYPLEKKFPVVPAPHGEFSYTRNTVGNKVFVSEPHQQFDNEDPYIQMTPKGYEALHDPNLKGFFGRHPEMFQKLFEKGLIDKDGGVNVGMKEFNDYRAYLGRLRNSKVNSDLRIQDMLGKHNTDQIRRIKRSEKKEQREIKEKAKKQFIDNMRREEERRQLLLQMRPITPPFVNEEKYRNELLAVKKREEARAVVRERLAKMRRAERRRARRLILEWYCRQLYADMMRNARMQLKKDLRQADLKSFIKSKREFQEIKGKYVNALKERKKAERECRIDKRQQMIDYMEQHRHEYNKQRAIDIEVQKQREMRLMRKYGMRWLNYVRSQKMNAMTYHDSVWRVRQQLLEMVGELKKESGKVSFTNFIQGLVNMKPGKEPMPQMSDETREIMNYILDLLIQAAFDTYKETNHPCKSAYEKQANRRRILGIPDLKPEDFVEPVFPKRERPRIELERPTFPCGHPCIGVKDQYQEDPCCIDMTCEEDEEEAEDLVDDELRRLMNKLGVKDQQAVKDVLGKKKGGKYGPKDKDEGEGKGGKKRPGEEGDKGGKKKRKKGKKGESDDDDGGSSGVAEGLVARSLTNVAMDPDGKGKDGGARGSKDGGAGSGGPGKGRGKDGRGSGAGSSVGGETEDEVGGGVAGKGRGKDGKGGLGEDREGGPGEDGKRESREGIDTGVDGKGGKEGDDDKGSTSSKSEGSSAFAEDLIRKSIANIAQKGLQEGEDEEVGETGEGTSGIRTGKGDRGAPGDDGAEGEAGSGGPGGKGGRGGPGVDGAEGDEGESGRGGAGGKGGRGGPGVDGAEGDEDEKDPGSKTQTTDTDGVQVDDRKTGPDGLPLTDTSTGVSRRASQDATTGPDGTFRDSSTGPLGQSGVDTSTGSQGPSGVDTSSGPDESSKIDDSSMTDDKDRTGEDAQVGPDDDAERKKKQEAGKHRDSTTGTDGVEVDDGQTGPDGRPFTDTSTAVSRRGSRDATTGTDGSVTDSSTAPAGEFGVDSSTGPDGGSRVDTSSGPGGSSLIDESSLTDDKEGTGEDAQVGPDDAVESKRKKEAGKGRDSTTGTDGAELDDAQTGPDGLPIKDRSAGVSRRGSQDAATGPDGSLTDSSTGPYGPSGVDASIGPQGASGVDTSTGYEGPSGVDTSTGPQGPSSIDDSSLTEAEREEKKGRGKDRDRGSRASMDDRVDSGSQVSPSSSVIEEDEVSKAIQRARDDLECKDDEEEEECTEDDGQVDEAIKRAKESLCKAEEDEECDEDEKKEPRSAGSSTVAEDLTRKSIGKITSSKDTRAEGKTRDEDDEGRKKTSKTGSGKPSEKPSRTASGSKESPSSSIVEEEQVNEAIRKARDALECKDDIEEECDEAEEPVDEAIKKAKDALECNEEECAEDADKSTPPRSESSSAFAEDLTRKSISKVTSSKDVSEDKDRERPSKTTSKEDAARKVKSDDDGGSSGAAERLVSKSLTHASESIQKRSRSGSGQIKYYTSSELELSKSASSETSADAADLVNESLERAKEGICEDEEDTGPKDEEDAGGKDEDDEEAMNKAAVKIQSSFRGFKTRKDLTSTGGSQVDGRSRDSDHDGGEKPSRTTSRDKPGKTKSDDDGGSSAAAERLVSRSLTHASGTSQPRSGAGSGEVKYYSSSELELFKSSASDTSADAMDLVTESLRRAKEGICVETPPEPEDEDDSDEKKKAAVKIQSSFRGFKTRKDLTSRDRTTVPSTDDAHAGPEDENDSDEKKKAADGIQSGPSSDNAQVGPEDEDDSEEKKKAAVKIQSSFRGFKTRKDLTSTTSSQVEGKSRDLDDERKKGGKPSEEPSPSPSGSELASRSSSIIAQEQVDEALRKARDALECKSDEEDEWTGGDGIPYGQGPPHPGGTGDGTGMEEDEECETMMEEMARSVAKSVLPVGSVDSTFLEGLRGRSIHRDLVFSIDGSSSRTTQTQSSVAREGAVERSTSTTGGGGGGRYVRPLPSDVRNSVLHTLNHVQEQLDAIRHELRQYGVIRDESSHQQPTQRRD